MSAKPPAKLCSGKSIGLRGGALREKIDALWLELIQHDSGLRLSDIVRDGLTAFWPQIEAYCRAKQQTTVNAKELATLTLICAKAREHGITIHELEEAVSLLVEQKLSASV